MPPGLPAVKCVVGIFQVEVDEDAFEAIRNGLLNLEREAQDQDLAPPADADRQLLGLKVLADAFDGLANFWLRCVEAPKGMAPKGGVDFLGFGQGCQEPGCELPSKPRQH